MKKIIIDGMHVALPEEQEWTLLAAAASAGIHIPTLCNCEELQVKGNCRVCMVEVWPNTEAANTGAGRLMPACSTLADDGMVVATASSSVLSYRREVVELILANHNRSCPACNKNKFCDLQKLADSLDIVEEDFAPVFQQREPERIAGVMTIRRDRCIRCGRCKAYCQNVAGTSAIYSYKRGWETEFRIALPTETTFGRCTLCGGCAEVCPVGCLTLETHLDRFWACLDSPEAEPTVLFCLQSKSIGLSSKSLEEQLLQETGYSLPQLAGILKAVGVKRVAATQQDCCEDFLTKFKAPNHAVILVTQDVSWKKEVRKAMETQLVTAVLTPRDIRLLIDQSLLDLNYIAPSELVEY